MLRLRVNADGSVLAGVGLAAALVMATAATFIAAGALLTFRGWPDLGGNSSARPLIVGSQFAPQRVVARLRVTPAAPGRTATAGAPGSAAGPAPTARGLIPPPTRPPFSAKEGA